MRAHMLGAEGHVGLAGGVHPVAVLALEVGRGGVEGGAEGGVQRGQSAWGAWGMGTAMSGRLLFHSTLAMF